MNDSTRLSYLHNKTQYAINELWANCFEGPENMSHMNAHVPIPLTRKEQLVGFLMAERGYKTWLIKRHKEGDIIGFLVHGNFFPGLPNSIGFNIGRKYIGQGYGSEALRALLGYLRESGLTETYGYCFDSNTPSMHVMEKCGFVNRGVTGKEYGYRNELKFKVEL